MPAWSEEIATLFVSLAAKEHRKLDQLQLQALVYIAHGWQLAATGQPLTGDRPVVTAHGPEYERIAAMCSDTGVDDVEIIASPQHSRSILDQDEEDLISTIFDTHGHLAASQLAAVTRSPASPWQQRVHGRLGQEIGHNEVRRQFEPYHAQAENPP